ncbi:MAG: tRNA epoxyqueuosine(34) reductase QueG [Polyangiaceae bacterium]|nr:tRNA epoxyqueuosine(34) reductase QueG [Polyangiaceae bacterium]
MGFARVGFARAERLEPAGTRARAWIARGRAAGMRYLDTAADRADVHALLPEAQSVVAVAMPYGPLAAANASLTSAAGTVAAYARGADYHRVVKDKLRILADQIATWLGRPVQARACVDTAPLLEREACARAGLGFIGKSTLLICPGLGSGVVLGELLVDVPIAPDRPERRRCGRCRLCLDACPTGALVDSYQLDARRCISYLTIEHRGWIPRRLRSSMGSWIFGCDVCQRVCPFNAGRGAREAVSMFGTNDALSALSLGELLHLGAAQYRKLVRGSALERVSARQLGRNAAVAAGNSGDQRLVPALAEALRVHSSGLVRGHAAWALGRLGSEEARAALRCAAQSDRDAEVRWEAQRALGELGRCVDTADSPQLRPAAPSRAPDGYVEKNGSR